MYAGRVIYGTNFRRALGTDAGAMAKLAPEDSLWECAFTALESVLDTPWASHPKGLLPEWKKLETLEGADCSAGGVKAALWLGREAVRLACKYQLMVLAEVPPLVQQECGVREADIVHVPIPEYNEPIRKRKRGGAKKGDDEKKGGPEVEKEVTNDGGGADEDEGDPTERRPGKRQTTLAESAGKGADSSRPAPGPAAGSSRKRLSEGLPQLLTPLSKCHSRLESSAGVSWTPGETQCPRIM